MSRLRLIGNRGRIEQKDGRKKPLQVLENKFEPIQDRRFDLIQQYSKEGFNWQSVLRLNFYRNFSEDTHITKAYNNQIAFSWVDKIMDNLAKRKSVEHCIGFVEQDDYLNNHLHFAWSSTFSLSRQQIAKQMNVKTTHIRDVIPIESSIDAISYFTKRLNNNGSYHNFYKY